MSTDTEKSCPPIRSQLSAHPEHPLSVGTSKTLEFLQWLGVDVPGWIQNDLRHADDTLRESYNQALTTARELVGFCRRVGVPFGINVESVSIRASEIEASVTLAENISKELHR
jgi:hypothetical protein